MPLAVRAVAFAPTPFLFLAGCAFVYCVLALLLEERLHRWVLSDAPKVAQFMLLASDNVGGHRGELPHVCSGFAVCSHLTQAVAVPAGTILIALYMVVTATQTYGAIIDQ